MCVANDLDWHICHNPTSVPPLIDHSLTLFARFEEVCYILAENRQVDGHKQQQKCRIHDGDHNWHN